jgi:sugar phosphate isomerase/epimerase
MTTTASLDHLCFIELTPPQLVELAASAGFACVGLRLHPAAPPLERQHPMGGGSPLRRETLARLHDTGVSVFDVGVFRLRATMDLDALEGVMETAAVLGARHVVVNGDETDPGRLASLLHALCERGRPYGLNMQLEATPWSGVSTPGAAQAVVLASGHAHARVLVDTLHAARCGATEADLRMLRADLIDYVQVCDAPAEHPGDVAALIHQARHERAFPGEGGLDLAGMLRSLPQGLPWSLEAPVDSLQGTGLASRARRARSAMDRLAQCLHSTGRADTLTS